MLTPQLIDAMNKATGNNVPLTPNAAPSRADQIRALGKQATSETPAAPPSFSSRVSSDIANAGNEAQSAISGEGKYAGESPVRRGTEAAATAFHAPLAVASEALPESVRTGLGKAGEAASGVVNWLGEKIGSTQAAQDFVTKHPDAAKTLGEIAGTGSALGSISGDILTEGGAAKVAQKAVDVAPTVAKNVKDLANTPQVDLSAVPSSESAIQDAKLQDALKETKPTIYKKGTIAAFEKAGTPGGIAETGKLGKFEQTPTPKDIEVANTVKDLVVKNKPIDSIVNINHAIARVANEEVTPLLKNNPSAFNIKTLDAHIRGVVDKPDFIKADPVLDKTYDLTRQRMLDIASKQSKTMEGLWNARKEFDAVAQKQLGSLDPTSKEGSVIKQAVLDTRRAVNDYIAENTPNGDSTFKEAMKKLNNMYEARGNIAESNYKNLDKNVIQRWVKANPEKAKAAGYALGGVAGTEFLRKILGI